MTARPRYHHQLAHVVAVPWEHIAADVAVQQNLAVVAGAVVPDDVGAEPVDVRKFHGVHTVPWKAAGERAAGSGSTVAALDHSTVAVANNEDRTSAAGDLQPVSEWDR